MRYFLAIPLPEEVKQKLHSINAYLSNFKGLRFVSPDNMHLTLLFLGENGAPGKVEALKKIRFEPFTLETSDISLFPVDGRARLIWVSLKDSNQLFKLQKELADLFGIDKDFKPHITLARIKRIEKHEKVALSKVVDELKLPKMSIDVKNFKLYSSELTVLGPVHRVIEYFECVPSKSKKK
jgi:RNA 2',3'-cyclic 3'-phosphodiesterase